MLGSLGVGANEEACGVKHGYGRGRSGYMTEEVGNGPEIRRARMRGLPVVEQ